MQLNITGRHVEITPALRAHVEEKMRKLERHCDHLSTIHVVLIVEKGRQRAEANFHVNQHDSFAMDEQDDLYKAIDNLVLKLDRQLLKQKEKLASHR